MTLKTRLLQTVNYIHKTLYNINLRVSAEGPLQRAVRRPQVVRTINNWVLQPSDDTSQIHKCIFKTKKIRMKQTFHSTSYACLQTYLQIALLNRPLKCNKGKVHKNTICHMISTALFSYPIYHLNVFYLFRTFSQ